MGPLGVVFQSIPPMECSVRRGTCRFSPFSAEFYAKRDGVVNLFTENVPMRANIRTGHPPAFPHKDLRVHSPTGDEVPGRPSIDGLCEGNLAHSAARSLDQGDLTAGLSVDANGAAE
ncbi:unnamed protein product [Schistocephalus solidus]|uniref:Uncharacterized protein n=1 Tax=Schistocephalus solidus TaxID=70667 RepID=A0A183SW49_SCHSO|nr:unnamed protein product [Schistocephalus solidus]